MMMEIPENQNIINQKICILSRSSPELLEAMVKLFRQGQEPHHALYPEHFGPAKDDQAIANYLKGFFKPKNPFRARVGYAKGWYINDDLCGYLLYYLNETTNIYYGKSRWNCYVEDIVVSDKARSMGGASQLLEALLADLEPLSDCAVTAAVWNGNAASEALFRKFNFDALSQSFHRIL